MNPANFKQLAEQIAISVRHLRYLLEQVEWHIPKATVWAFGSRIKWSHRPESDLDLAVHCDKETARKGIPKLNDALQESDLPFKVQILDFNRLPVNMQQNIKKNYLVLYQPEEKTLPSGWKETTLGKVVEITSSKRIFAEEYLQQGVPFYRGKEIIEKYNGNEVSTELFISHEKYNQIKEIFGAPQPGEMLLTSVGTLGIPYLVKKGEEFYFKDGNLTWFKNFNGIENTFLYYWLISDLGKEQLTRQTIGSTQQALTIIGLKNISILLPPLPEQRAIAAILSSFDDKIELLRRQNKTLGKMAQATFKEWFVKFTVNGKKLKVNSKTGLPEGWRMGTLGDEFEIIMGQSPDGASYNESGEGMIFFQGRAEFQERFPATRLYTTEPKRIAEKFDVLVSVRAPVGDINVASDKCCIGRGLAAVRGQYKSYALYKIKSLKDAFNKFEDEGTVFGCIGKDSFANIEVIIPDNEAIKAFEAIASAIDGKIYNNYSRIQTLSKLRDTLLPKLMKGEIRVKDTELFVKDKLNEDMDYCR